MELFNCPICLTYLKIPVITNCGHTFCQDCFKNYIKQDILSNTCPNCKTPISSVSPCYLLKEILQEFNLNKSSDDNKTDYDLKYPMNICDYKSEHFSKLYKEIFNKKLSQIKFACYESCLNLTDTAIEINNEIPESIIEQLEEDGFDVVFINNRYIVSWN